LTLYTSQTDLNDWSTSKVFELYLMEGESAGVKSTTTGGGRFMRFSINYYNKLGYPEILNSNYNQWLCDGMTLGSTTGNKVNFNNHDVDKTKNYKPLDFTSSYIWGTTDANSSCTYSSVKSTIKDSVIYITACSHLEQVILNSKPIVFNTDLDICERVKTLTESELGASLKSGDVIKIKVKKATTNQVTDKVIYANNSHYTSTAGSLAAVIAYRDKFGVVREVLTNEVSWTCDLAVPNVIPFGSSYRGDFYLNTAFGAKSINNPSNTSFSCETTLP